MPVSLSSLSVRAIFWCAAKNTAASLMVMFITSPMFLAAGAFCPSAVVAGDGTFAKSSAGLRLAKILQRPTIAAGPAHRL